MATNNNRTITWSQVLKTLGAVGVIIAAIITGVVSIITTNMQINANSNSSGPDFSPPGTSTSEKSTNDSPPYTAETNDSNTSETLDEKESSNSGSIDNPIHKNITEEANEEQKNDSPPNVDIGIPISESTSDTVFTHEYGKIELTDDHSGIAYIYKDYIDYYAIGSSIDGLTISGLDIGLNSGDESFQLFVYANKYNGHTIECSAQYYINGIFQYNFSELPSFFITNCGDLQIEFSCKEIPFDLRDSSEITIGHSIEV